MGGMSGKCREKLKSLRDLIAVSEDWLMHHVLSYAREHDYTRYTSTLAEAWRISIAGLSQPLIEALDTLPGAPELGPDQDYTQDPIAAFGILEARLHRSRGITLPMFLGLMKYYRQSYQDLVEESDCPSADKVRYRVFIDRFFDRVELGFIHEWSSLEESNKLEELQAANRNLTNEKNKYLTVYESMQNPVFVLDREHRIENINHAAAALFAFSEVPGAAYYSGMAVGQTLPWLGEALAQLLDTDPGDREFERPIETAHGLRYYQVTLMPMLDISDKFTGTVVKLNDVTMRRRWEQELVQAKDAAETASHFKSTFLANMSHEIRTPLNGVIAMAELLGTTPVSEEQGEYIEAIHQSVDMLLNLINDVLDLAKIEAGKFELHYEPFEPCAMVTSLINSFRIQARKKGLEVSLECPPADHRIFVGDPYRIRQVLMNLLSNALKFTHQGTVMVRVGLEGNDESGIWFKVEVSDTGIGISANNLRGIFESFRQADGSTARKYGGSGLGLAISSQLVEIMGGRIWVNSEPGQGSNFHFIIPLKTVVEDGSPAEAATTGLPGRIRAEVRKIPPLKILLAEDHPVNRKAMARLLEKQGHEVEIAENGLVVLDIWESRQPDLILMDLQMPEMNGYQCTALIRKREGDSGGHIPIIALTADATVADRERCLAIGMDGYVSKPARLERLLEEINHVMTERISASRTVEPEAGPEIEKAIAAPVPVLDLDFLKERTGDDPELVKELLEIFLADIPRRFAGLRRAVDDMDADQIRILAHSIKGSAMLLGAQQVVEASAIIEEKAIIPELGGSGDALAHLASLLGPLIQELKAMLQHGSY